MVVKRPHRNTYLQRALCIGIARLRRQGRAAVGVL
jgi:hypothetical protein